MCVWCVCVCVCNYYITSIIYTYTHTHPHRAAAAAAQADALSRQLHQMMSLDESLADTWTEEDEMIFAVPTLPQVNMYALEQTRRFHIQSASQSAHLTHAHTPAHTPAADGPSRDLVLDSLRMRTHADVIEPSLVQSFVKQVNLLY